MPGASRCGRVPAGLLALLLGIPASVHALQIPVDVVELVPRGVSARPRPAQVVRAGIPLAADAGIRDVDVLGMSGTNAAQFRILQRDPHTGDIQWVLATFQAAPGGGPYALVSGGGDFGGPPLVTTTTSTYVVDTGAARFEIARSGGFRLLDRAVVGGREIVAPHAGGGVVVLAGGVRYTSAADAGTDILVEENGPVAATIRARGVLRDAGGTRHLGYTVRLQFERGAAICRAFVTLRNAELASLSAKPFSAAWIELPVQLGATRQVAFGTTAGTIGGTLSAGQGAWLFQGDNTFQRSPRTDFILDQLTPAAGLEVQVAGATRHALGNAADCALGWMRLDGAGNGVLAGMRDLATNFPSGFEVTPAGDLCVDLFSRHNPKTDLTFSWGAHETREVLLQFGPAGGNAEDFRYALQYPLLGRCSFEHYRSTGAVYGETRLVTIDEERAFFAAQGHTWDRVAPAETDLRLDRQYSFSTTGGGNQFDHDLGFLIDFMRSGDPGWFQQARLDVLWRADQSVTHSDDFDYGTRQNRVDDVSVEQPPSFHGKGARNLFDDEHPHWVCMPIYYYLTGDENVREAIEDYGEWRRYRAGNPTYGPIHGGGLSHFRMWSRAFRDVALLYRFTGQTRYLEDTRRMARVLTETIEQGTSKGRNLERGYFYFGDESDADRRIHLFFLTEMNPIAVREAILALPPDDPLREALRDYLSGLAHFTLREAQVTPDAIGYPYGYYAAIPNTEPGTRGDQTGILLVHGYETSGDATFIERARDLTWRVLAYQHMDRGAELSTHLRIYRWLHRDEVGAVLVDPAATRNADGSWTLRWTAPADARAYIVKYGPKPLVENLDFDQLTRTYRVDPGTAMNFWAATNVPGEPAPGPAGTTETFTTPVLPEGPTYFKVKVLLGAASTQTPATVTAFGATTGEGGVDLAWELADAAVADLAGITVQRAPAVAGPWEDRSGVLAPSASMSFQDAPLAAGEIAYYRLRLTTKAGATSFSEVVQAAAPGTGPQFPVTLQVTADPGPGKPVPVRYRLGTPAQHVALQIYDVRGHRVRRYVPGTQPPGDYVIAWDRHHDDGRRGARGIYFVRLEVDATRLTRKLVLLHAGGGGTP